MSDSHVAKRGRVAVGGPRRPLGHGSDALVRAVGRVPANVHTKLLIAFVGTSVLLVAVGVLGLRVLGQSNDRVGSLGSIQERAVRYAQLQQDAWNVRQLLVENVGRAYYLAWNIRAPASFGQNAIPVDRAVVDAAARIGPATADDRLGFTPPPEEAVTLATIRMTADRLTAVMKRLVGVDGDLADLQQGTDDHLRAKDLREAKDLHGRAMGLRI